MERSIFISKNLSESNQIIKSLSETGWNVIARSLIRIQPLDFSIDSEDFQWLFLSSTNGADILFKSYTPNKDVKIGAAGNATAKAVRKHGFEPTFIGQTGDMMAVGRELASKVKSKTILFAGAECGSTKIRLSIPEDQIRVISIYRTLLEENLSVPETDAVFLTSPSNAESYLNSTSLKGKTVIAIGQTTAEFLREKGLAKILVPQSPKEEDILKLLLSL